MTAKKRQDKKTGQDAASLSPPEADNVDRIRDIIFGTQMRDYESRFQALEKRLGNSVDALRDEMIEGLNGIQAALSTEVNQLTGKISAENADRSEGLNQAANQLAAAQLKIHQRLEAGNQETATGLQDLEENFNQTCQKMAAGFDKKIVELTRLLDEQISLLRVDKTDRTALADLLTEVAGRLREES